MEKIRVPYFLFQRLGFLMVIMLEDLTKKKVDLIENAILSINNLASSIIWTKKNS